MLAIYDKYYTEKDIKDLVAFYKSSAGQKMVKVSPDLNKEIMTILLTKYVPEIQSKMKF